MVIARSFYSHGSGPFVGFGNPRAGKNSLHSELSFFSLTVRIYFSPRLKSLFSDADVNKNKEL